MAHPYSNDASKLEREGAHSDPAVDEDRTRNNNLAQTMTMSPSLFEKMYLGPKTEVKGDLRKMFANPSPLALLGFSVGLLPLSIEFMGWRGSGGFAIATTTCSIWFGGVLLLLAGIGEFILGNTFPFLVFMGYGCHFLTFATTFIPWFNAVGFYAPGNDPNVMSAEFAASFGFYPLSLALLSFVYLIGSLRTNGVFALIFVFATLGFSFATATLFYAAKGMVAISNTMTVATGACFFGADMCGWYLLLAEIIAVMELPVPDLPVFDLSTVVKARPRVKRE